MTKSLIPKIAVLAAMTLLFCSILLINTNALAQPPCPDGSISPSPDEYPWTLNTFEGFIAGTDCDVFITYCERSFGLPDTTQLWLDSVSIDSGSCDTNLTDSEIVAAADSIVFALGYGTTNPNMGWCDDGWTAVVEEVFTAQCWFKAYSGCWNCVTHKQGKFSTLGGFPGTSYTPCSGFAYWCEKSCSVCYSEELQPIFSNCITTQSELSADCQTPPNGAWLDGNCYILACDESLQLPPPIIQPERKIKTSQLIDTSMQLYPDPASAHLIVTSSVVGGLVQVLDVLGGEMMREIIPVSGQLSLDISSLPTGVYYISVGQTEKRFEKK